MVGIWAMAPERIDFADRFADPQAAIEERDKVIERLEKIGSQIMNRASSGPMGGDPIQGVLGDGAKRDAAAQLLGQAFVTAYALVEHNKDKVERVAQTLVERREMHGDEVVELLDSVELSKPEIDLLDETVWPKL
jgi:hypothetical protein